MSDKTNELPIPFGKKLTSSNISILLNKYWESSFSDNITIIKFDLHELEWISIQESTIWFGWIFQLIAKSKKVIVSLQSNTGININKNVLERRQRCLTNLFYKLSIEAIFKDKIRIEFNGLGSNEKYILKNYTSVIPFYKITPKNSTSSDVSKLFDIEHNSIHKKFPLDDTIRFTLEREGLNQIDNNALNYVINKELFSNVCQHAYVNSRYKNECYFSLGYSAKIDDLNENLTFLLNKRIAERHENERDFFRRNGNISFLEYTFMDFGIGIPSSLGEIYNLKTSLKETNLKISKLLSKNHFSEIIDNRIIEYAFLLFTSRFEFEEDLILHDYLPRGLYVVKDIVRRNDGLLICRSGKGQVTYDFGSKNKYKRILFSHNQNFYPGTLISIIFPSKANIKTASSLPAVTYNEKIKNNYRFINLLKIYSEIPRKQFPNQSQKNKYLTEHFFIKISTDLHEYNNEDQNFLIYIDFAGIDLRKHDYGRNLLYFFSLSPLVNEKVKIILINISDYRTLSIFSDINKVIAEHTEIKSIKLEEIDYLCKPIPCVLTNREIFWIGVRNQYDSSAFTNLWIGNPKYIDGIENLSFYEGHFFVIDNLNNKILVNIPLYIENENIILEYIDQFIQNEINNNGIDFNELNFIDNEGKIHNYNKIKLIDSDGRDYLVSSGKYQSVFLCFIEKLFIKEYRQLLASYLIFKYICRSKSTNSIIDISSITKILTVTLSSQLIGKEVRDICNNFRNTGDVSIKLIPLSNYYEFDLEEPFKEIIERDSVLVVNDVISTGKLSSEILNSLSKEKKGIRIAGILTVVDSRLNRLLYPQINQFTISLSQYPIEIRDFPKTDLSPIWINSIINAPVTMPQRHGDDISILFEPKEFLDLVEIDNLLQIGHLKRNTQHHTYLINQTKLYENDKKNQYQLFKNLFKQINKCKSLKDKSKLIDKSNKVILINNELLKEVNELNLLSPIVSQKTKKTIQLEKNIRTSIKYLERSLINLYESQTEITEILNDPELTFEEPDFNIDFVFFPFLSSITEIMDDLPSIYHEVNPNKLVEVYPIPRIMTPDGWRFSFPPKFLNNITSNSRVFIIDDGSWTGDTLIQMIDSVSFLAVSEIYALSIVAKLDDFRREFLTRIQFIKSRLNEIPIHIFFGTHLHIPVYHAANDSCPFIAEEKYLLNFKELPLPIIVKSYVEKRLSQIKATDSSYPNKTILPTYIPEILNKPKIFLIRNFIGKYESYRFYREDIEELTKIKDSIFSDIHYLIFIILHEPHLLKIIKKLDISNVRLNEIEDYLFNEVFNKNDLTSIWPKKSIIRLLTILNPSIFYDYSFVIKIVAYISNDKESIEFISFYFYSILLDNNNLYSTDENKDTLKNLVRELYEYTKVKYEINSFIAESFRQVLNKIEITPIGPENDVFRASQELEKIYFNEETEGEGHNSLDDEIEKILNNIDANHLNWSKLSKKLKIIQKNVNVFRKLLHDYNPNKYKYVINLDPTDSFLNSIEIIDSYYNKKNYSNKSNVYAHLEKIKENIISPNSDCYNLFFHFGCMLHHELDIMQQYFKIKLEKKNINIRLANSQKREEKSIRIHQHMLRDIFGMFFENIIDHVENNSSIEYSIKNTSDEETLEVIQTCKIDLEKCIGLGLSRIISIVSYYKGTFKYFNEGNNGIFIFTFKK